MALLTINGVVMPTPTEMQIGAYDISKAERNAKGNMIIERINTKKKLEIKYAYITAADLQTVMNAVSPTYFSVTYLEPQAGDFRTSSFYAGDRTVGYIDYINGIPRYKDFGVSLIEL